MIIVVDVRREMMDFNKVDGKNLIDKMT